MYKRFEEQASSQPVEKPWISEEVDHRLIFSVYVEQFKRGMINIAGGDPLETVEDPENEQKLVVLKRNPEEVICRYRESTRGGILVVFSHYEHAAWFEDGLNY